MENQWDLVRSISGMRATATGAITMRKDLMINRENPYLYHWNVVELRSFQKIPQAHCCVNLGAQGQHTVTGEADEPVQYSKIVVYAATIEKATEIANLLQGAKTHKADDLFELAKAHQVIIYPVTVNGWLYYDGIVGSRHERKEITDRYAPRQINQILNHGIEVMQDNSAYDIYQATA